MHLDSFQQKIKFSRLDRNSISLGFSEAFDQVQSILDCGSRDGHLLREMQRTCGAHNLLALDFHNRISGSVRFLSHNLETPLPFADLEFDVVICNDVLEHVEAKTQLIKEVFRTAKKYVIISLPNTQHHYYIKGLIKGRMSKQYNFLVDDGSDRHKWVTYYDQNLEFIALNTPASFCISHVVNTVPGRRVPLTLAKAMKKFFVFNQIFLFERLK